MKDLCSYRWVHDTYGDALPDVPWISRPRAATPDHAAGAHRATGT